MKHTVYILYSATLNQYSIGHTHDLTDRIFRRDNSGNKPTTKPKDWKVVYTEIFNAEADAYKREMQFL